MNTSNPKHSKSVRRKRPTILQRYQNRSLRSDGAIITRIQGGKNRSKYLP